MVMDHDWHGSPSCGRFDARWQLSRGVLSVVCVTKPSSFVNDEIDQEQAQDQSHWDLQNAGSDRAGPDVAPFAPGSATTPVSDVALIA
jgi:hypothetical protein